jgi:hypothetical protein
MIAEFTFQYVSGSGLTEKITLKYDNPFIEMLAITEAQKQQVFNLCALSYVSGRLEQEQSDFTNLQLFSINQSV